MKKISPILLAVLLIIFLSQLTVGAQDSCQPVSSVQNGITIISTTGCREVRLIIEGTQVYPAPTSAPTLIPLSTPAVSNPDSNDTGADTPFTDSASIHITYKAQGYVYVHKNPDFRSGYVITDLFGKATLDKYYPVLCMGKDNWYQIEFNRNKGWIHIKSSTGLEFAELVNSNNKQITVCQ